MTRRLLRPGKLALYPSQRQAEGALTAAFLGKGMLKEVMEVVIRKRTKSGYLEIAQVLQRGYNQGRYRGRRALRSSWSSC